MPEQLETTLLKEILTINTQLGRMNEIIERHDKVTFPTMQNTLTRMESKHNQDYLQYIESKDAILKRIEPLEAHVANHEEIKAEDKKSWSEITKHTITSSVTLGLAWLAYKLGINK